MTLLSWWDSMDMVSFLCLLVVVVVIDLAFEFSNGDTQSRTITFVVTVVTFFVSPIKRWLKKTEEASK